MPAGPEVGSKRRRDEQEDGDAQEEVEDSASVMREETENKDDGDGDNDEEEEDEDEDEDEDDDSDVEFILGPSEASAAPAKTQVEPATTELTQAAVSEPSAAASLPAGALPEAGDAPASVEKRGTLDIDAVGTYNGQPISQIPPSNFEEKPWRRPGADLSDYFNYGFDEFTWMAYCSRQDKLRAHFTPQQVMQSMPMGGAMGGGMAPVAPIAPMAPMPPFMMPPMMFPPPDGSRNM